MAAMRNSSAAVGLVAIMKNTWSLARAFACDDRSETYLHVISELLFVRSTITKITRLGSFSRNLTFT
jgi:hypothetical protein